MLLRTLATPLTIGSFIVVCLTGLGLFFGVRGLINPVHEITSLVFVAGCLLHLVVNWKPTVAHLRKPLGATLAIGFALVTLVAFVPRKGKGDNPRQVLGQTMAMMLESDLRGISILTHESEPQLAERLARAGFPTLPPGATLRSIAEANRKAPSAVLAAVLPPAEGQGAHAAK